MNATVNALSNIESYAGQLTKKEKLIAEHIINYRAKVIHQSITELAEDIGVADSTVFRFCKRVGFDGFQAFKIALARDVVQPDDHLYQQIGEQDSSAELMQKVFYGHMNGLQETLDLIEGDLIEAAVQRLASAKKIFFYGTGGSAPVAQDAVHKLMRTGLDCRAYADGHMQIMTAATMDENSVAFGVTHSGSNKDLHDALIQAKKAGAYTMALTQAGTSPVTKIVDLVLPTQSKETRYRSEALSSRLIQLAVIDVLYLGVAIRRKEETFQRLEKIRHAIAKKRF